MRKTFLRAIIVALSLLTIGTVQGAKKVHTLGDSTMAPYNDTEQKRGWGMYFGNFLTNGWTAINYAKGGRDSRGGFNELWQNAKNNVEAGDYVIIQFAHNDGKYRGTDNLELQAYYNSIGDATNAAAVKKDGRGTRPSTTYKACLKQIIDAVRAKGATPVLVSAVSRCYFSSDGKSITNAGRHNLADRYNVIKEGKYLLDQKLGVDDHSMDYVYHMKQLAKAENVSFIDMTEATAQLYLSYGSFDNCHSALFCDGDKTHFNLTGAFLTARLCAKLLKENGILEDAIDLSSDLAINPSSVNIGNVYLGQSGIKELTLMGLALTPVVGTAIITATEDIQLSSDKKTWSNSIEVKYENGSLIKTIYAKVKVTTLGVFKGIITARIGEKKVDASLTLNGIDIGGGNDFSVKWALPRNDAAVVEPKGLAIVADSEIAGMVRHSTNTPNGIMVSTSKGGTWTKAEDDSPNQYVQFTVTAPKGHKLNINTIAMKVGAHGGNGMRCHVYYSTDGFVTRTAIYAPPSMSGGVMNKVDVRPVISLEEGDQLQIRVYPWYNSDATGKWLSVSDVVVSGQSQTMAGK